MAETRARAQRDARRAPRGIGIFRNSIASKLILLLMFATVLTSLVVTWVATSSIESFLRGKVDQKFPAILASTAERLDLWYSQRRLDIETFSRSTTLVENAGRVPHDPAATSEVHEYLTYVLDRFPQYSALFLLAPDGLELVSVGSGAVLDADLRARLSRVATSALSDVIQVGGRRVQVSSSVVVHPAGGALGSLHALMHTSSLDELLASDRLGDSGQLFLVGSGGVYLTPARGRAPGEPFTGKLPGAGLAVQVEDYRTHAGERVVGGGLQLDSFGWTLIVEENYAEAFKPALVEIWKVLGINLVAVLIFSGLAFGIAQSVLRPIRALSAAARTIAEGKTEIVIESGKTDDELGILTQTFNRMATRLRRNRVELEENRLKIEDANARLRGQNEELVRMNEALEQLSITDGLTRLHNHRFFQEQLTREIGRVERAGGDLSLVLIDIDNFKQLNDQYGHAAGDEVLCAVAKVMGELVRETDVLARYGGEEFALLPNDTTLEGAIGLAEKLRAAISDTAIELDREGTRERVGVTVSIGVASYRGDRKQFFNEADRALYRAKEAGKDCVAS